MTDPIDKLRQALAAAKGWNLDRVELCHDGVGVALIGASYDDGNFAPILTVDTGLYYAPNHALPLASFVSAACTAAPALLAEVDALRAEVARLRADAERYRWLTQDSEWIGGQWRCAYEKWDGCNGKAGFDAAIDAARTGAEG